MSYFKIIILLLFYFVSSNGVKAQANVYHPFPDSNATWCCSYMFTVNTDCYYGYSTFTLKGTQTINNILYSRMLHHDSSAHEQCIPPLVYYGSTVYTDTFFIRQDTLRKTVWIFDSVSNSD